MESFENVMKYMKIELDATVSMKAKALQLLRWNVKEHMLRTKL